MIFIKKIFVRLAVKALKWSRAQEAKLADSIPGCRIVGSKTLVKLGGNISLGGNVIFFANSVIEIGDHTMIGINTIFHTSTHNYDRHPMWMERIDRPIRIGCHVWIGANVIIAPGVIVEDYAVVGTGSVVIANVPKFAIVAGNPARVIKFREPNFNTDLKFTYPDNAFVTKENYINEYCKAK